MTQTVKKLMEELERLPEAEQEERAASYLEDLQRRHEEEKSEQEDPYSALKLMRDAKLPEPPDEEQVAPYASFTLLQEADLDLPSDYSETYEQHLYGRQEDHQEDDE